MMNEQDNSAPLEVLAPSAVEAISRAEVDISIATARKFPRELGKVKQKMMSFATLDEETAQSCFYTLPRGGKNIQGPSVRLAEIAVSCYGNLRAGSRIISTVTQGDNPHVVVQAVASDLENNISISIEKRRRITKKKSKPTLDEDDINLASNACSAIAFRDAVFKIIPLALIKPVFEGAKKVAIGDAKTLADRRTKSLDTFGKMGIPKERVLAKLEKKTVEEIDLGDIETMIGLYNAIKDGEVQLDEAFPPVADAKAHKPEMPGANAPSACQTGQKPADRPNTPAKGEKQQEPQAEKQPEANKGQSTPPETGKSNPDEASEAAMGLAPEQKPADKASAQQSNAAPQESAAPVQTSAAAAPAEPDPKLAAKAGDTDAVASVKLLAVRNGLTHAQLMAWAVNAKLAKPEQALSDLAESKLLNIANRFAAILPKIQTFPR